LNNFFFLSSDPAKFDRMVGALVKCVETFKCLNLKRCAVCSAAPDQKGINCLNTCLNQKSCAVCSSAPDQKGIMCLNTCLNQKRCAVCSAAPDQKGIICLNTCLNQKSCAVCSAAPYQKGIICLDSHRWWNQLAYFVGGIGGQKISVLQVKKMYMIARLPTASLPDSSNGAEDKLNAICGALGITSSFRLFKEFREMASALLRAFNAQQKLPIFPLTKKRPDKVIDSFVLINYISV